MQIVYQERSRRAVDCSDDSMSIDVYIKPKEEEEEEYPAFCLPCGIGCCPETVSTGPIFFLQLLLYVVLDRKLV
jgi:hypothetical protein